MDKSNKSHSKTIRRLLLGVGLFVFVGWYLGPIVWAFVASITSQSEIMSMPPHWIPQHPTLDNYQSLLFSSTQPVLGGIIELTFPAGLYFRIGLLNSLIVASVSTIAIVIITSLSGYTFARINFRGKEVLFALLLFNLSVPTISTIIPDFKIIQWLGLYDTIWALILLHTSRVSLPTWIFRNFFETVPHELEESAQADGCSRLGALFRVVLPFSRPGVIAVAIIAFLTSWNDLLIALIFASSPDVQTFPVVITEFATREITITGLMFSAAIISFIIPIIIAFVLQKYLIAGLTAGSVKG